MRKSLVYISTILKYRENLRITSEFISILPK